MTEAGKKTLVQLEAMKRYVYEDSAGLPTIGVGHLLTKDELSSGKIQIGGEFIDYRMGLTPDQCLALMEQDLEPTCKVVDECVKVPLNPHQRDSLILFAFNVGVSAFRNSTLLKKLNAGEYAEVPDQLSRWVFAGGKVVKGLANRRRAESELWSTQYTNGIG